MIFPVVSVVTIFVWLVGIGGGTGFVITYGVVIGQSGGQMVVSFTKENVGTGSSVQPQ